MYDLLIVGAGITAATLAARLKEHLRICVIDCRSHIGGNCFDFEAQGTHIHRYGPHIFHCPSPRIIAFLSAYTQWRPYTHTVLAEVRNGDGLVRVPFPYCRQTAISLGHELSEPEIINTFFRGYSQKMWGMAWEHLPRSVRGRIPAVHSETPVYYRDRFVALPLRGYAHMIENMLDGVELILGAPPAEWTRIPATTIVYTGRPDRMPVPGEIGLSVAERYGLQLGFRTLDIGFAPESWHAEAICLHACSTERPWTRKTCFAHMTGGRSTIVSTEVPKQAADDEVAPYYPIELQANMERYTILAKHICELYPNLHLAGRLGCYRYFDMYQVVGHALAMAKRLLNQ